MKNDSIVGAVVTGILNIVLVVVAIYYIYHGAIAAYDYGYRIFKEPPITTGEGRVISVTINEETTPRSMGEMLEAKGLIRDKKLFILQYYCSEFRKDIQAGTYELSTAMTVEEMLEAMTGEEEGKK